MTRLQFVPLDKIDKNSDQPRKDLGDLSGLASTVKRQGVLQSVVLQPAEANPHRFQVVAGGRRIAAARVAGEDAVPAIIWSSSSRRDRLELQLIENIQRKDLEPLEEAEAYRQLLKEFAWSQRELARRLGRSPAAICEILKILNLPSAVLKNSDGKSQSELIELAKIDGRQAAKLARRPTTVRELKALRRQQSVLSVGTVCRRTKRFAKWLESIPVQLGQVSLGERDTLRSALGELSAHVVKLLRTYPPPVVSATKPEDLCIHDILKLSCSLCNPGRSTSRRYDYSKGPSAKTSASQREGQVPEELKEIRGKLLNLYQRGEWQVLETKDDLAARVLKLRYGIIGGGCRELVEIVKVMKLPAPNIEAIIRRGLTRLGIRH